MVEKGGPGEGDGGSAGQSTAPRGRQNEWGGDAGVRRVLWCTRECSAGPARQVCKSTRAGRPGGFTYAGRPPPEWILWREPGLRGGGGAAGRLGTFACACARRTLVYLCVCVGGLAEAESALVYPGTQEGRTRAQKCTRYEEAICVRNSETRPRIR